MKIVRDWKIKEAQNWVIESHQNYTFSRSDNHPETVCVLLPQCFTRFFFICRSLPSLSTSQLCPAFLQLVVRNWTANVSAWILMSDPYFIAPATSVPATVIPASFPWRGGKGFKPTIACLPPTLESSSFTSSMEFTQDHEARVPRKSCETRKAFCPAFS